MKKIILSSLIILCISASNISWSADFEDGKKAYDSLDFNTAFQELLPEAQQGNYEAQAMVAWMYREGKGTYKDSKQAFYWIQKAAKQGLISAQNIVGVSYLFGHGVGKDRKMAKYWIGRARENGHIGANEVWNKYKLWQ